MPYWGWMLQDHPDTAPPSETREEEAGERGLSVEIMETCAVLSDPDRRQTAACL